MNKKINSTPTTKKVLAFLIANVIIYIIKGDTDDKYNKY